MITFDNFCERFHVSSEERVRLILHLGAFRQEQTIGVLMKGYEKEVLSHLSNLRGKIVGEE